MNVYVETNFVLNFGLRQEGHNAVVEIVALAQSGRLTLVLPAMAALETISSLEVKRSRRKQLITGMNDELGQLKRSKDRADLEPLETGIGVLAKLNQQELIEVQKALGQITACARLLTHTERVMSNSIQAQQSLAVDPVDSMIYGAIFTDLENLASSDSSCFLSTDGTLVSKVFGELKARHCTCFTRFDEGLEFVQRSMA